MADTYWACLDSSNKVKNVIVVDSSDAPNDSEGAAFCKKIVGSGPNGDIVSFKSYNFNGDWSDGDLASIGGEWSDTYNQWIMPKPFASWVFNTSTKMYDSPVAEPNTTFYKEGTADQKDVYRYWDETQVRWEGECPEDTLDENDNIVFGDFKVYWDASNLEWVKI
jgi:hypothetical protein|tara:strand:+ start:1510 stop:2004 length:495 start_codon:yes stop_codon:yes gene_type:complete